MALSSTGVFEVRTAGHDDNAGYFNPGGSSPGTDFSQQDAAEIVIDGATMTAAVHTTTTQINITGATVSATWNRNGLRITGGTATAGLYEITAVDVGNNRITVDRAAGTSSQTVQGRIGGALGSPGGLGRDLAAHGANQTQAWLKSGTYTLTGSTANVSGGPLHVPGLENIKIEGYESSRGDLGQKPIFSAGSVGSIQLFKNLSSTNQNAVLLVNLKADGNSQASTRCFEGGNLTCFKCDAVNALVGYFLSTQIECLAENCTTGFSNENGGVGRFNLARGCTTGFFRSDEVGSVADGCGTGFTVHRANGRYSVCINFNSTGDGFLWTDHGNRGALNSCVAYSSGGYGFNSNGNRGAVLVNCSGGANTSGNDSGGLLLNSNFQVLTADPFVDAANGDFNLNDTAGGGAALRAVNFPLGDTDVYPFNLWVIPGGGGGPPRIRQGNLLGRSF